MEADEVGKLYILSLKGYSSNTIRLHRIPGDVLTSKSLYADWTDIPTLRIRGTLAEVVRADTHTELYVLSEGQYIYVADDWVTPIS